MARQGDDEIEVVFGFKQVCGFLVVASVVLFGVFVWGLEAGHKRALRGDPSVLGFLAETGELRSEPVEIPDVLLSAPEAEWAEGGTEPAEAAPTAAEIPVAQPPERVKPKPSVKPQPSAQPVAETPAVSKPAKLPPPEPKAEAPPVKPPAPTQEAAGKLHYQVAALKSRQNAKSLVDRLRTQGWPARIQPEGADGLFRVYVGPFRTSDDAEAARTRLARDGFQLMARRF